MIPSAPQLHVCAVLVALGLALPSLASAETSMLSFFPEDVEVERTRGQMMQVDVARLGAGLEDPVATRRQRMQSQIDHLFRNPPTTLRGQTALACMAVAIFHEARGESITGQRAVASVILQKSLVPDRWGDRPCEVVRPVQFSFMTGRYDFPPIERPREADWRRNWRTALDIAADTLVSGPMDELVGADHYHATYVAPVWRKAMPAVARIGDHIFYADPESAAARPFH